MKTPRFLLIGVPILIVLLSLSYILTRPHLRHREEQDRTDRAVASTNAPAATNGNPPGPGHRMSAILAQLDLTDAQKTQIDEIRRTTTDRQQRHDAIMNVLTPDQRTKFDQLRAAQGNAAPVTPAPAP